jgi:general secretion pathway protein K
MNTGAVRESRRGGALLAVLWLSAALSAIVLTLAITVRGELERAGGALDSARAYYLAEGAIERFLMQLQSPSPGAEAGSGLSFLPGQRRIKWELPTGSVEVEITGENGKLNLFTAEPQLLARLFVELGVEPNQAAQIAGGIAARRAAQRNLSEGSSFSSQFPSFLQLEDLLSVSGVTADVYYGWWTRDAGKRLVQLGGIARCLTLLDGGALNVNYAPPEVLRAAGVPDGALMAILQTRESTVIQDVARFGVGSLAGGIQLVGGGSAAYTVRATAQLKNRPVRRSVAAVIRFGRDNTEPPLGVVRWYPAGD